MTADAAVTTPEKILDIATGYMAAKQLFAASRVGLFTALADGPKDVAGLAATTGVSEKMIRILADAMNSVGLVDRAEGKYTLTADAADYLAGKGAIDLAPFMTFLNDISYGHWLQFDKTVDTTTPGELQMDEGRWGTFMNGVMTYNALHAAMMARSVDYSGFSNLLDMGGLSPAFAVAALKANPTLTATFVYAPDFTESVTAAVAEAGATDRTTVQGAPTETAQPEGEFDAVMLNHVIHRFTAEQNVDILRNARAAATAGATLFMVDFYLDDDERQRGIDALHAGEYFVIDGTVVWPIETAKAWLEQTGWRFDTLVPLPGSPRVLVATAV